MENTSNSENPAKKFTYWFPLEGDEDYEVHNLTPIDCLMSVQILEVTHEDEIPDALERVRLAMLSKETPNEQLDASAGLPCTFNSETGRYVITSNSELVLKHQLKILNQEIKLISSEDLKALLKKRRGESTSQ